jgi:hypothetical protein
MAARALTAVLAAAALLLAGCGGGGPDTNEPIENAVRAVYGATDVFLDESPSRKEVAAAREPFCDAVVVYVGARAPQVGELATLPVPLRSRCRAGFNSGEAAKVLGLQRLSSVGRITVTGDRAEARFRAVVPGEPKETYESGALLIRRGERWRVVLPCAVIGCYPGLLPARHARRPRPKVLVERRGRYRGTTIGDLRSVALQRQGTPPKARSVDDKGPVDSNLYEDGTPSTWTPPGNSAVPGRDLNYRGRAYLVEDGAGDRPVYGFIITDRRAETSRGVGIGDTLAYARRRYPQLRCDVVNQGTEYVAFPACRARIAPRRYLGFGQNPIASISLMTVPFDGAR